MPVGRRRHVEGVDPEKELGEHEHPALVEPIGERTRDEAEKEDRHAPNERDERELRLVARKLEHEISLGEIRDLAAGKRNERADPKDAKVSIAENL